MRRSQKLIKGPDGEYIWVSNRVVSDAPKRAVDTPVEECIPLGCIAKTLPAIKAYDELHGFKDVKWVEDPDVPGWYDPTFKNQREMERYAKLHQQEVKNGQFSGVTITEEQLEQAKELVNRVHRDG